ncbi:MAG: hypothetical protein NTZ87_00870 [Candidatus Nomurabacteria bacterium]|nr:hypothetical protein [Candidatus Nomurabacteria bacterium]
MKIPSNFPKIPFLLSIIFLIFSCFLFSFFYRAIDNNNKESQIGEEKWQNEASRRDEIRTFDSSVKIIEEERAELETHFAKSSDVVPFLDTIEGLASKVSAKAEITSVDILADNTGLLVGMKASGTFSSLYKFLTLLENSPYELEFDGMSMLKETASGVSKWNVTFQVKLLSFIK